MRTIKGLIYLILLSTILYLTDDLGRMLICIAFLMGLSLNYVFKEKE
jgi:hypothetical protein